MKIVKCLDFAELKRLGG